MKMEMEKIIGRRNGIIFEKKKKVNKMEQLNEKTVKVEYNEADYIWSNYRPEGLKSFRLIKRNGEKINVQLAHPIPLSFINEICQPISIRSWQKRYRCSESHINKYLEGSQVESWGQETYYLRE